MDKYLFTSSSGSRRILIGYEDGLCREFSIEGSLSNTEIEFLMNEFPWTENGLTRFEAITRGKVTRIAMDLTFAAFWNSYAYKVGNKGRTEKLWNTMNDVDKAAAMKSIPIYESFLSVKKNQDKVYPETFLSQRRFENNYKMY